MPFQVKKISDYGTSNPFVARLGFQFNELMKFFRLSKDQQEKLFGILLLEVQPKALTCFKIKEDLKSEEEKIINDYKKNGLNVQSQGKVVSLPSIVDLKEKSETFLYNSKILLRDYVEVFNVIFNASLAKEARYDKVCKWAKDELGKEHKLTLVLNEDHDLWINKIVKMRNAVEHPGGHSGHLHIEDFSLIYQNNKPLLKAPVWYLNDETKSTIILDMEIFLHNILTFCEDTFALCLEIVGSEFPLKIVEVPELERNKDCPIRFRVVFDKM